MNEFENIRHPQIDGISLFFDTLDYRTPHFHPEWELLWIMQGALSVAYEGGQYEAGPGELVLFGPGRPHEFHARGDSCTFLCVQVSPRVLTGFFPAAARTTVEGVFPKTSMSGEQYAGFCALLRDTLRAYLRRDPFYELGCAANILELWRRLFTCMPSRVLSAEEAAQARRRSARLARLMDFVDQNYTRRIRLADFAAAEGCTMNHMSAFVRQNLNQSFQQYVNTVRFHCACKLIAAGRTRMTDVCLESGFSDYRYFSREFRRRLGMTPEEYSRRAQPPVEDEARLHHSIHSRERFYSRQESLALLDRL